MFFAAPMPTGIDNAMPTTVETTVIQRLSAMPSAISSQRLTKSGGKMPSEMQHRAAILPTRASSSPVSSGYQRKIDHSPNDQCPAKPGRPDQRWFFPVTGRGGGNDRHFASPSSRAVTTDGCLLDITSFPPIGRDPGAAVRKAPHCPRPPRLPRSSTLRIVADQSSSP